MKQKYITMSRLTLTESLGSQMSNLAVLYAIARTTGHRILFVDDIPAGKGLVLNGPFVDLPIEAVASHTLSAEEKVAHTFDLDTEVPVDSRVFELDSNLNYDFDRLFSSYRYWYPVREEVFRMFRFRPEIAAQAAAIVARARAGGREVVSLHVRRNDFLDSPWHVNLSLDYYANACSLFKGDRYVFLVFSDDIEWCKATFSRRSNFVYSAGAPQAVDMCAMSLCDHNIVANSTFSTWGALLNANQAKKVICPNKYLKEGVIPYVNYAWFPDHWIGLDDLVG